MRTANDLEGGHPGASWRTAGGRTLRQARGLSPFPVSPHIARFLRTSQAQGATPRKTSIPTTAKASTHRRLLSCPFRPSHSSAQTAGFEDHHRQQNGTACLADGANGLAKFRCAGSGITTSGRGCLYLVVLVLPVQMNGRTWYSKCLPLSAAISRGSPNSLYPIMPFSA